METEVREVVSGRNGLILVSKGYNQKYHLVSKSSIVSAGNIVKAKEIVNKEKFAIYECEKISEDRMILKIVGYFSYKKSIAIWKYNKQEFDSIPGEYIECQTEIFSKYSNSYKYLALVKIGFENTFFQGCLLLEIEIF